MLVVCKEHVKEGITCLDVPHVKKISDSKLTCSFCKEKAKIQVFYFPPFLGKGGKVTYKGE